MLHYLLILPRLPTQIRKNKSRYDQNHDIFAEIADALTRAHRLNIIRRDIKPANVLLAEDGTPRMTGFGVARIDEKTRITETGMVVGTLSYLSPEELDGKNPMNDKIFGDLGLCCTKY